MRQTSTSTKRSQPRAVAWENGIPRLPGALGIVQSRKGNYDEALALHDQAMSIQLSVLGREHPDLADSYLAIGHVFQFKGDHDKALSFKEKALAIYLDEFGEQHEKIAEVYNMIAIDYSEKGDYNKGLEFFVRALSIWRETLGELHFRTSYAYNNVGVLYTHTGDYEKGITNLKKGLAIKLQTVGEKHLNTIYNYNAIGQALAHQGEYSEALVYNEKALSLTPAAVGNRHPVLGNIYETMANIHEGVGDYGQAIASHKSALATRQAIFGRKHPYVAWNYNDLARIYAANSNYDRAITSFQHALNANVFGLTNTDPYINPPLLNILSETHLLTSLAGKGEAFINQYVKAGKDVKNLRAGVAAFEHASRLMDEMRGGYKAEASKLFLAQTGQGIHEKAIHASLKLYKASGEARQLHTAFRFAEKNKGGILLEALSEAEARQFANLPDSLLEKERQLRIDLAFYERNLISEQIKGNQADSAKLDAWGGKMFGLEREYEKLLERFERDYREYYNLKFQINTATVQEIQSGILDAESAMVEYVMGEDSIFIFTITRNDFHVKTVARDSLFDKSIQDFRKSLIDKQSPDYKTAASFLYHVLLKPASTLATSSI